MNVSNMFLTTKNMNIANNPFGLTTDSDTHMMKNTEWGAVAYLSHSEYGTCTNGTCTEVYPNSFDAYVTGCGADSADVGSNVTCKNQYGTRTDGIYNQSTTKNINGIFDMGGGVPEFVMACTTLTTAEYGESGFTKSTFPGADSKYIDIYSSTSETEYSKRILGDATGEMGPFNGSYGSWYYDSSHMITSSRTWVVRGGMHDSPSVNGMFAFGNGTGGARNYYGFRIVIS